MAGETIKSAALTSAQGGSKQEARLTRTREVTAIDSYEFQAATELEAGDNLITNITIPTNAIVTEVSFYNDDLDSGTTLVFDVGYAAGQDFVSTTSSADTKHSEDDILDADALVDGSTTGQAATTSYVVQAFDATTKGPDDALKAVWQDLGYDNDPGAKVRIVVQSQAAATGLAAPGELVVKVKYLTD